MTVTAARASVTRTRQRTSTDPPGSTVTGQRSVPGAAAAASLAGTTTTVPPVAQRHPLPPARNGGVPAPASARPDLTTSTAARSLPTSTVTSQVTGAAAVEVSVIVSSRPDRRRRRSVARG